jgi:hypothetical protein
MELSPSRKVSSHSATTKIFQYFMNPNVHGRVHKSPPVVPILSQVNQVHTTQSYLSMTHFNIMLTHMPVSSYWSLSFCLSHQNRFELSSGNTFDFLNCVYCCITILKFTLFVLIIFTERKQKRFNNLRSFNRRTTERNLNRH